MRIAYFGDGPWAHRTLDRLLAEDAHEVRVVVPRYDTQDPELRRRADAHGIDFLPLENVNAPDSLERLAVYGADLLVSMSFNQILRSKILELCPLGAINCHAGALPYYRGRNILNWVLINDEPEFGVTVHYMDEGIDTGDIILQRMSPITDADTYATLLERAIELCAETLYDAISLLAAGRAPRIDQTTIHPVGFYTGRRFGDDVWIDWSWSSRQIFNFVRGLTLPSPGALTAVDGAELRVIRAELIPDAPNYLSTPGEVVGRDGEVVTVKTGDNTIALTDIRSDADLRLRIGTRMQSPSDVRLAALESRIARLERDARERGPS